MLRQAVDSTASSYWTSYFKDSGYGALWVRKLPRRIKAALVKEGHFQDSLEPTVTPIGHGITKDRLMVDGIARAYRHGADGKPQRVARTFKATFDHAGKLVAFVSVESP